MLLAAGANAMHADSTGLTPMGVAVRARADDCVQAMAEFGVQPTRQCMHEAARIGATGCLARLLLLKHLLPEPVVQGTEQQPAQLPSAPPAKVAVAATLALLESVENGLTPYLAAISAGHVQSALVLLGAGAHPLAVDTRTQRTAVHLAAKRGCVDCLLVALMAAASAREGGSGSGGQRKTKERYKTEDHARRVLSRWLRNTPAQKAGLPTSAASAASAAAAASALAVVAPAGCTQSGPTQPLFDAVAADSIACVVVLTVALFAALVRDSISPGMGFIFITLITLIILITDE